MILIFEFHPNFLILYVLVELFLENIHHNTIHLWFSAVGANGSGKTNFFHGSIFFIDFLSNNVFYVTSLDRTLC